MPKIKLHKVTMNLRAGDYQRLQEVYAHRNLPASTVIRALVSNFVDALDREVPPEELDKIKGVDL